MIKYPTRYYFTEAPDKQTIKDEIKKSLSPL